MKWALTMIIRSNNERYNNRCMVTRLHVTFLIMYIYKFKKNEILIFLAYRDFHKKV